MKARNKNIDKGAVHKDLPFLPLSSRDVTFLAIVTRIRVQ